jgi:YgiT-type zinc finger domain-containing protein
MRHNCGGTLEPRDIRVEYQSDGLLVVSVMPGLVCNLCGEQLISPATFERAQTPTVVLPSTASSLTEPVVAPRHPVSSVVRLGLAA